MAFEQVEINQAVQAQKMAIGEILDLESKELYCYCEADLHLCFRICKILVFS